MNKSLVSIASVSLLLNGSAILIFAAASPDSAGATAGRGTTLDRRSGDQ